MPNSTKANTLVYWPDAAILNGMLLQTKRRGLKWNDADRRFAISLKAKTATQTLQIAKTGDLQSSDERPII